MGLGQTAGNANTPFGTKHSPCGTSVYKSILQTEPRESCISETWRYETFNTCIGDK